MFRKPLGASVAVVLLTISLADGVEFECANDQSGAGNAYQDKEDYDQLIAKCNEAIRLNPKNVSAYVNRGNAYQSKMDFDHAISDFTEAVRLGLKQDRFLYGSRGDAYSEKKDYDHAIADYSEAIRLNPKDPLWYPNRGYAYLGKKDYHHAFNDFTEAIRLAPKDPSLYLMRGNAYADKREYDHAITDYNEAVHLDPKNVDAYLMRGNAYHGKTDYGQAMADYSEAVRVSPSYGYAYDRLAWLLASCPKAEYRNGKKAIEYATKACELTQGKNVRCFDTMAMAYAENGQFDEAIKWGKKALENKIWKKEKGKEAQDRLRLYKQYKPYREE